MLTLLTVAHLVIGVSLVLFVLLQDPKGGAMGVFSGGSSANSFFGASGASNFLTTTTKWLAILFAVSSLGLTYMSAKKSTSVMDDLPASATTPPAAQPSEKQAPNQQSIPGTNPALPTDAKPDAPKETEIK
jgi:preprotein translocase subunit SecG